MDAARALLGEAAGAVGSWVAGLGSDLSEEPVVGVELAAQEFVVAPGCPPRPVIGCFVAVHAPLDDSGQAPFESSDCGAVRVMEVRVSPCSGLEAWRFSRNDRSKAAESSRAGAQCAGHSVSSPRIIRSTPSSNWPSMSQWPQNCMASRSR